MDEHAFDGRHPATPESVGEPDRTATRLRLDGRGKTIVDIGRNRLLATATLFAVGFAVLAWRLVDVSLLEPRRGAGLVALAAPAAAVVSRADILDRNGAMLATSLITQSLYADARLVREPQRAARRLVAVLPDLDPDAVLSKLSSGRAFVWLKRNLTPRQVYAVNRLGQPALAFVREERRIYPQGPLAAHLVGFTGIDNHGLGGVERSFENRLRVQPGDPLRLSVDLRFQHVLRQELSAAMAEFRPIGSVGLVLDVETGEVAAMVSLPDFDPNQPGVGDRAALFNRATLGIYEMGSTFKIVTAATALDMGTVTLQDGYDASEPLRLGRHVIRDYHAQARWLSVPEIFMYSSNIGAAKMALDVGTQAQIAYLDRLGLLAPSPIELPEVATPLFPERWREIHTATIGFGHGVAVSPVQLGASVAALVNDGIARTTTVLKRDRAALAPGRPVISARASRVVRQLMRLVVTHGTGRKADAPGYMVGGKTGSAEKVNGRGYDRRRLLSSFIAAFPINKPRYLVLVLLDEPKGNASTHGYATAGWTAAPVVGRVIARIGPLAGLAPVAPSLNEPAPVEGLSVSLDGSEIRLAAF